MIRNRKKLKQFINSGIFSNKYNNLESVVQKLELLSRKEENIKIIYGETYDQYGLTIDSLKYYLVLAIINDLVPNTKSSVIIGDIASLRNIKNSYKEEVIKKQVKDNLQLIQKFINKNGLEIKITRMSELFENKSFKKNLKTVTQDYNKSSDLRNKFEKIVLKNKLKEEYKKDFLYSREEIALIMNYQVKFGPPREQKYDEIASEIMGDLNMEKLLGLYLKPTYPLGMNFDYFVQNREIEKFGITPYKAGSNKLQSNRLVIAGVKREYLKALLKETFVPQEPDLPNPLKDLYIVLDLLRRFKEEDYDFPDYSCKKVEISEILELIDNYLPELYE